MCYDLLNKGKREYFGLSEEENKNLNLPTPKVIIQYDYCRILPS